VAKGTIKSLVRDRGFGFIAPEGGSSDVFFHRSALAEGDFDGLRMGQTLEFDVEPDPRDPRRSRAVNVRAAD
jgi:cold shock protein